MKSPAAVASTQRGAALLIAMLTVTFVALFAATAFWQQWREVEIEAAERARVQSDWILVGARDWARAILREDARSGGADYLTEPWALPMPPTPLSAFLAADKATTEESVDSSLSFQITDLQSRLNILNLVEGGRTSGPALHSFVKLFGLLNLDPQELTIMVRHLARASASGAAGSAARLNGARVDTPLMPQRMDQLIWLGLSRQTISALRPYVTLLPERTPVNINTASAMVLCASVESLELADAQRLVLARDQSYFRSLNDPRRVLGELADPLTEGRHSVASRFFELHSRLRLQKNVVEERVTLQRDKLEVKVLWKEPHPLGDTPADTTVAAVLPAPAR